MSEAVRVTVIAEIEIHVDVDFGNSGESSFNEDVAQAVQNEIGHTGAKVMVTIPSRGVDS